MALKIDIRCKFEILRVFRPCIFVFTVCLLRQIGQLRGSGDLVRATFRAVAPGVSRGDIFRPSPLAIFSSISAEIIAKAALVGPRRDGDYPPPPACFCRQLPPSRRQRL